MRAAAARYLLSTRICASLSAVTGHTAVRRAQKEAGTATRRAVCAGGVAVLHYSMVKTLS